MAHLCKGFALVLALTAAGAVLAAGPAGGAHTGRDEKSRVIAVFDFQSAFDKGVLGKFAAANFRAKISRYELFTTMEDEDREEAEGLAGLTPRFDTPAAKALAFAKKWLEAEIVMLGKVEEAGGEALRITVKVYDAQTGPVKPRFATTVEVASKYAIQVGVFNILGELTGRKDPRHRPLPADAEERWRAGPSLVRGDFEEDEEKRSHAKSPRRKGMGHPVSWEPFGVDWQMKEAHWESHPDGAGKCIVFRMSGGVAAMEGVAYYSQFFDIEPGATYRVSVKVKSMAPTVKIFVKYYAWLHTPGEPKGQWREVGRSPMNCKGPKKQWGTHVRDCHPRVYQTRAQRTYTPKKCRIGLYAYHPGGVVYFDDVVFKKLAAAPKEAPKPYDVGETGRQPVERKE